MANIRGHIWLLISTLFFSSSILCMSEVIHQIPNFKLNALRFILGGSLLLIMSKGLPLKKLKPIDYRYSLLRGMMGIAIYYLLETAALHYITANMVSILVCLCYIVETSYSWLKKERVSSTMEKITLGLTLVGTVLICYGERKDIGYEKMIIGVLMMVLASISWGIYVHLEETKPSCLVTSQIVGLDMILGGVCILPFIFNEAPIVWQTLTLKTSIQVLYLAICPSALAYYFYNKGTKVTSAGICALYMNLIPIISLFYITICTGEKLLVGQWLGIGLVILSLWIGNRFTVQMNKEMSSG